MLALFPTAYPNVIAHHVTLTHGSGGDIAPPEAHFSAIGMVDDCVGVQAIVVQVDGKHIRPDGRTFHITWSIDRTAGRKPVHSNDAIEALGFRTFSQPVVFVAQPRTNSSNQNKT